MEERDTERLAFVGDSITAKGDWPQWFPEFDARNHGVSGDTTEDVLGRIDRVIEEQPHAISLLIGSNDFGNRRSSVEHVVRNIETILVEFRRELPGTRMLVQSIMPRGREFADFIRDANRHLWQFSATVHAQYLDLWPALALDDGELSPEYTHDRLHLNEDGYEAWLRELRPAIERLRDAAPMSRPISIIEV